MFIKLSDKIVDDGNIVINVNDLWLSEENKRYSLSSAIIDMMVKIGYIYKNTIIWDKRNLVNGVGIFGYPSNYITMGATFEYLINFQKQ